MDRLRIIIYTHTHTQQQQRQPHLVKADLATVKMVLAVVAGEVVCLAIKREGALGDAVGETARNDAKVRAVVEDVVRQALEPERDLSELAITIGDLDGRDGLCVRVQKEVREGIGSLRRRENNSRTEHNLRHS